MADEKANTKAPPEPEAPEEEEDIRFKNRPDVSQTVDATGLGGSTVPLDPHADEPTATPGYTAKTGE